MDLVQHLVDHHVDSLTAIIRSASDARRRGPRRADRAVRRGHRRRPDAALAAQRDGHAGGALALRPARRRLARRERPRRWPGWPPGTRRPAATTGRWSPARSPTRPWPTPSSTPPASRPTTHTLGGTIGHVITFAAVRRTLAVGALWTAGIKDFDAADPRPRLDALRPLGLSAGAATSVTAPPTPGSAPATPVEVRARAMLSLTHSPSKSARTAAEVGDLRRPGRRRRARC